MMMRSPTRPPRAWRAVMVCLLAVLTCLALPGPAVAADPAWSGVLSGLARDAMGLAAAGRSGEMDEIFELLDELGMDAKKRQKLRARADKALGRALGKPDRPLPRVPHVAKRLRTAAAALAEHLPPVGDARAEFARLILRLDHDEPAAREALGHVRNDAGGWSSPEQLALVERGAEIRAKLEESLALEVPLEQSESRNEFVRELQGEGGVRIAWRNVQVHSASLGPKRMSSVLKPLLRAMALAHYLQDGELSIPRPRQEWLAVLCGDHGEYVKAIRMSKKAGGLDAQGASIARQVSHYEDRRGFKVVAIEDLPLQHAGLLVDLWHDWMYFRLAAFPQPCIAAGHLNWLSLAHFERPIPGFVWKETEHTKLYAGEDAAARRETVLKAARSLEGTREHMRLLALRGLDPPWSRSVVKRLGRVNGEDLLKSTLVVDWMQQRGPLSGPIRASAKAKRTPDALAAALKTTLGELESEWRAWIAPGADGLAKRLEGPPE